MFTNAGRLPFIGGVTLALIALASGLLMWFIMSGTAGAKDVTTAKLHGNNANAALSLPTAPFGFGFVDVSTDGTGKNKVTNLSYDNDESFGFGTIPNGDFTANPGGASLDTDSSRVTGTVLGPGGPITVDWTANGFGTESFSGNNSFGFGGETVTESGSRTSQTADASGSVAGHSGSTLGPTDANIG